MHVTTLLWLYGKLALLVLLNDRVIYFLPTIHSRSCSEKTHILYNDDVTHSLVAATTKNNDFTFLKIKIYVRYCRVKSFNTVRYCTCWPAGDGLQLSPFAIRQGQAIKSQK